ncbi:MAG: hypothetical protein GXZ00_04705 [Synergistaceae bacterium]|nr:hypothetical protein [Synergistaceae bacterium]
MTNSQSDEDMDRKELIRYLQDLNEIEFNLEFKSTLYATNVANNEFCDLYDNFFAQKIFEHSIVDCVESLSYLIDKVRDVSHIRDKVMLLTEVTEFLNENYECTDLEQLLFDEFKKYLNFFITRTKLFEKLLSSLRAKSVGCSYSLSDYNADLDKLKEGETYSVNLGTSLQRLTSQYMKLTEK